MVLQGPLQRPPPAPHARQGGIAGRRWKISSKRDKLLCLRLLNDRATEGVLPRGAQKAVASQLGIGTSRVCGLWKKYKNTPANLLELTPKKKLARLGLRKLPIPELKAAIKAVDPFDRKTYRDLASALDIPVTTLHEYKTRDNVIRRDNSRLKPRLTDQKMTNTTDQ
jgi:NADH:ubiquinone oxidoreductase subunit E